MNILRFQQQITICHSSNDQEKNIIKASHQHLFLIFSQMVSTKFIWCSCCAIQIGSRQEFAGTVLNFLSDDPRPSLHDWYDLLADYPFFLFFIFSSRIHQDRRANLSKYEILRPLKIRKIFSFDS